MKNSIVDLLSKLVRINSVNLTLSHGPGEYEIAKFIRHRLDELELSPEIQTIIRTDFKQELIFGLDSRSFF
jgi:acetylornithine deacetylase/succinyl-diaminopimelate desuccinylase-like protein